MIIELNSGLVELPTRTSPDLTKLVTDFYGRIGYALEKIPGHIQVPRRGLSGNVESLSSGMLGHLSKAYSRHQPFAIAPHDIWYLVLTELATQIKNNTEACRPLFSKSATIENIAVQTSDPTQINLLDVIDQLRVLVPSDIDMFLPALSTHTPESNLACVAALCDGIQKYYSYSTFMCGIPAIKVTGTLIDWQTIQTSAERIASQFELVGVPLIAKYMYKIATIIGKIVEASFIRIDVDFWKNIFTQKNVGSGSGLHVDGWITDLFFKKCSLPKLENFTANISVVPYKNVETGRRFKGVHGAFKQTRTNDGFVVMEYGDIVFEILKGDTFVPDVLQ